MGLKDQTRSILIESALPLSYKTYVPKQYSSKQHEFFNAETRTFNELYAKYSSDYVDAEIQGLDPDRPFDYVPCHLRLNEIVKPSGSIEGNFDSYKQILMAERQYEYIRKGAKVRTMGNTWLVINPANMSSGEQAIIQRCDITWNYLDYYGNICHEPMCIDTLLMRASTPDSQRSTMITKGYFNCMAQYNEATKQLFTNSRMVLGSSAYILTGFSDFIREFTDEPDSVNLMRFALRYEEPNDAIDDMVNKVAGGKTFSWNIRIDGESTMTVGDTEQFTAQSIRTSGAKTETVWNTEEHPITYIWESTNPEILSVDETGMVTAKAAGSATVSATLEQNPDKAMTFNVTVADVDTQPHIALDSTIPKELPYGRSVLLSATYYEDGEAVDTDITWTITGANEEAYTFEPDGNTATLRCWGGSVEPAFITAAHGAYEASVTIYLQGI